MTCDPTLDCGPWLVTVDTGAEYCCAEGVVENGVFVGTDVTYEYDGVEHHLNSIAVSIKRAKKIEKIGRPHA